MNTFSLRIIACDRLFYDGECEMLIIPGYDGEMGIMANHMPMTTAIEVGEIKYKLTDGTWQTAIVSDGLIKVNDNHVEVLVFSAERPDEIDAFRAQAALERAKEQLMQKQSIMEYHISSASLARAMARLRGVEKFDIN